MTSLAQDLRFALRHFRRTPITTVTMTFVLAIGIGVNSALFMTLSSTLSRPPAGISRDKALVRIRTLQRMSRGAPEFFQRDVSYPEFQAYTERGDVFASVIASGSDNAVLDRVTDGGGPAAIPVEFVSPGYFQTLGVRLALGPGLLPVRDDPSSAEPVAVISDPLWRERFGAAGDVVGKIVHVNGVAITIVGVAPSRFGGSGDGTTIWMPLSLRPAIVHGGFGVFSSRDSLFLTLFARLRPDVSVERATTVVQTIAARAIAAMSSKLRPYVGTADVVPIRVDNRYPAMEADARTIGAVMAAITLLVLVITCLNVSALLAGSAVGRSGEIAIRLSLGASRARIVRQLLTESTIVAVCGAALGLLVVWLFDVHVVLGGTEPDVSVGWETTLFTLAFALGTVILFGTSPALHATRVSVSEAMKESATHAGTSRSRLQRVFVIAQVALTQPLLVGLGILFVAVLGQMETRAASGIRDHVISADVVWRNGRSQDTTRAATLALEERLRGVPGVIAVVRQPNEYGVDRISVHPADRGVGTTDEKMNARLDGVAPGYLALMDIPIVRGHDFTVNQRRDRNAVIIGSDLARTLWGAADPIGKRLQSWRSGEEAIVGNLSIDPDVEAAMPSATATPRNLTVVGVVDATKVGTTNDARQIRVFVPSSTAGSILIRTSGPASAMVPVLRAIANKEFPDLPLDPVQTLAARDAEARRDLLQASEVAAGAGMLILLLASIGLYGVVAFAVGQRTREIGIRIALGAAPTTVVAMFLRSGAVLGGIGLAIGLPLSVAAMRIVSHTAGLPRVNPLALTAAIALIVVGVSLLATWLPARRAARVDPLVALRSE
jgi:predicted permease